MASRLEIHRRGDVVKVRLGESSAEGALTEELDAELCGFANEAALDDSIRAVLLGTLGRGSRKGSGARRSRRGLEPSATPANGGLAASSQVRASVQALAEMPQPVIVLLADSVHDEVLELALACDLRVASNSCRMALRQVTVGSLPHHGGTQRLPRLIGHGRSAAMMLLGLEVDARRAYEWGLVNEIVIDGQLWARGARLADQLAVRGPIASRLAKESLRSARDLPLAEGLRLEGDLYVLLQTTADRDEGIASFREKRRPSFRGR